MMSRQHKEGGGNHLLRSLLLLISASVLACGLTLGVRALYPSLGVKVFNPLSTLFPTPEVETPTSKAPEPIDPLLLEAMRQDSLEQIARAEALAAADSAERAKAVRDSILRSASLRAAEIPAGLTDYSGGHSISLLRDALAEAGNVPVNIAFLGDSFIEGDILVAPFRSALQAAYGGSGVGYVPITSVTARFRQSIKHRFSGSWEETNALTTPGGSHFLITGSYQEPAGEAEVSYQNSSPVDRATLLYSSTDSASLTLTVNDIEPVPLRLEATDGRLRQVELGHSVSSLSLSFASEAAVRLYGVLMDGAAGVRVDNMSLRGSSGLQLGGISPMLSDDLHAVRPYQLIILSYGLNVVSPDDGAENNYGYYFSGMDRVLGALKELYPEAILMIVSISDRGQLYDGEVATIPGVPKMVEVQNRLARKYGALFFNTYGTVKEMGGIEAFVSKGWAAKDYTHMSYAGGREIAHRMVKDLTETDIDRLTREREEHPIADLLPPEKAEDSTLTLSDEVNDTTLIHTSVRSEVTPDSLETP